MTDETKGEAAETKGEAAPRQREEKAKPTIGVFAGIVNQFGKLLVKRRQPWETFPGDWDLPGGALNAKEMAQAMDERIIGKALKREVYEETGINIDLCDIDDMPAMYPVVVKGGSDMAFLIVIGRYDVEPTIGEWRYVDTVKLLAMCGQPKGNQLVSGFGKRMCRMCLKTLAFTGSMNFDSASLARRKLAECY